MMFNVFLKKILMTSIIINAESAKDLKTILVLAKRLGMSTKSLTTQEQEDYLLLQAMLKSRKRDYVSRDVVMKKLHTWK